MPQSIVETWVWFVVVAPFTVLRDLFIRVSDLRDLKRLQLDDYLMIPALAFFLGLVVSSNNVCVIIENLDANRSQTVVANEAPYIGMLYMAVDQTKNGTIWLVKGCLLTLYYRITRQIRAQHVAIICLIVYVILGFFVLETFYYGIWCRPFSSYFYDQVGQCRFPNHHLIMEAVFNISSDFGMLCIFLPMLARSGLPIQTKLYVCGVFTIGVFVIFCSAASKYYTFKDPWGVNWAGWYCREAGTAIIIANIAPISGTLRRCAVRVKGLTTRGVTRATASIVLTFKTTSIGDISVARSDITATPTIDTSISKFAIGKGNISVSEMEIAAHRGVTLPTWLRGPMTTLEYPNQQWINRTDPNVTIDD